MGAASCFETPHFVRLLSMRPRRHRPWGCSRIMILSCACWRTRSSLRQPMKRAEITANQRFLFCTRPALHLPLGCDGVGDPLKPLGEYQGYRATLRRIAAVRFGVVLRDPLLET